MRIDGACHCGAVRYVAEIDPGDVTICHCTDCQVLTGTAFRVSVAAAPPDLRIVGDPKVYAKRADSGRIRNQYFCGDCGTPLFTNAAGDAPGPWGIRWGSIRQRERLSPTTQIWRRSAAPWICAFEDAPARQTE